MLTHMESHAIAGGAQTWYIVYTIKHLLHRLLLNAAMMACQGLDNGASLTATYRLVYVVQVGDCYILHVRGRYPRLVRMIDV